MEYQTPVGEKNVIKKLHVLKNEALISISKMDGKCAKTVMPRQWKLLGGILLFTDAADLTETWEPDLESPVCTRFYFNIQQTQNSFLFLQNKKKPLTKTKAKLRLTLR